MVHPMEVLGEAIYAYWQGDRSSKLFLEYLTATGSTKFEVPVAHYFRKEADLTELERKLILLAHGKILVVGCATGYHMPALMKQGEVLGIDIAPQLVSIALSNGLNCQVADIFDWKPNQRFHTITLFGNNLGLGGSIPKTKELLLLLNNLLTPNGKILALITRLEEKNVQKLAIRPIWKDHEGPVFPWMRFNLKFLALLCKAQGLTMELIDQDQNSNMVKLAPIINRIPTSD